MVVMKYYTVQTLTVRGGHWNNYKLLWKLRLVMRGNVLQLDIYDYKTIQGSTRIIIGYEIQYFRQSLMPSELTGNIMEGQIKSATPTLGLMIKQLRMGMPIRVSGIPGK